MSNGLTKIEFKQNKTHLSEVLIKLNFSSDEDIEFLLDEEVVNHLYQKRNEEIEIYLNLNEIDREKIILVDFSKLRQVKPVYPLLQQGLDLPKIKKNRSDQGELEGTYSIIHKNSGTWLSREGWGALRQEFDIFSEKIVETFLSVTLIPPEAVESGAQWRLKDGPWRNSTASIPVTTGRYFVEFKEISGWVCPQPEQIQVVDGIDEKISLEYSLDEPNFLTKKIKFAFMICIVLFLSSAGLYFVLGPRSSGNIVADISPPAIIQHGAKWRVDNGDWQQSGTIVGLESGEHFIEFMPVNGWEGPKKQKVTIKKDQSIHIQAPYSKLLVVNLKPEGAVKNGAQWKLSNDNHWRNSGDKIAFQNESRQEILFKEIENWTTPEKKIVSYDDSTLNVEYAKKHLNPVHIDRSITISILPAEAKCAGAQWKIDGPGKWKSSGETLSGLISIPYTVIFRNIAGWQKPGNMKVLVKGPGNICKEVIYKKILEPMGKDQQ